MEKSSEKESSRRSWPWKRKSNDKISAAPEMGPSPVPSKSYDNHQIWEYRQPDVPSHQRHQSPMKASGLSERSRMTVDEAKGQWLQSEERAKCLSEKLSSALADNTSKDNLVKQHVKVAEEAVSGWEKAEAEAVSLKAQLDAALQQKLVAEDREAHLDGALKECMKQLRLLREENEQRIHDTLLKKTREYDKLRLEMDTKLAESSHFLSETRSELLESRAEITALNHALQERLRTVAEIGDAKARAETEIKVLQVRLETMEKDNSQLKYEVHVLNKELDIRSQEREYERKAVDLASKQHLESVKKIAKLEEECNRLRLLVRKKLPGPAAIQRMRMEVEGVSKDPAERRRRSVSRSGSALDLTAVNDTMPENGREGGHTHEAQMLAERVVAMGEEMKVLKEALSQRNAEIQTSRLLCSKTSAQLAAAEEELKMSRQLEEAWKVASSKSVPVGFSPSSDLPSRKNCSLFDPARDSALSTRGSNDPSENFRRESLNFELMDDFAEMERLAMSATLAEPTTTVTTQKLQDLEEALASRTRELEGKSHDLRVAEQMCQELRAKLKESEKQLQGLQSHNASNAACIVKLQEELDLLAERERGRSGSSSHSASALAPSRRLSGFTLKDILGRAKTPDDGRTPPEAASSSEGALPDEQASVSDAESKTSTGHLELAFAVRKIVHVSEMLAQTSGYDYTPAFPCEPNATTGEISLQLDWHNHDLKKVMRTLVHVSNKFLQGKSDLVDFTVELGTVLDYILAHKPLSPRVACLVNPANKDLHFMREQCAVLDAELERLRSEKVVDVSSSHLKAVERVESLRTPPRDFKLLRAHSPLQIQHGGDSPIANPSRKEEDLIEEELMVLSSPNPALRAASGELTRLRDRVAGLERELQGERQRHQGGSAKLGDHHQVQRECNAVSSEMSGGSHRDLSSHSTSEEDDDSKSEQPSMTTTPHSKTHERQDRDVQAAALAECQRTILALGKQLKGLGTVASQGQEERETSPKSTNSSRSIEKMTENMELLRWQTEAAAATSSAAEAGSELPVAGAGVSTSEPGSTYTLPTASLGEHAHHWASTPSPRRGHRSPSPAGSRRPSSGIVPGIVHPTRGSESPGVSMSRAAAAAAGLDSASEVNGPLTPKGPSPAGSEVLCGGTSAAGSVPSSPSRASTPTPWALRSRVSKDVDAHTDSDASVDKNARGSSSFSRFYSRTRSGSVGGSFG